ncbi:MAG: Hsp20/alpha crystallin family protein [Alphaproteobacteria bacterium]|nr:Hsp20/alpha crystallin family protein [Alphaproteobacteria bacterium]
MTTPHLRAAALPVDLYEREDALLLIADLPGVAAEDLDIQLEGDTLSIGATRHEPMPRGQDTADDTVADVVFRELGSVRWERTFRLRTPVDRQGIDARLEAGVLTLTLPKAEEARPHSIPVNVA